MLIKIQYANESERNRIIELNLDKFLVEEQNIVEGNFFIFSDVKPLENQVADLQDNQLTIMNAIADLYNTMTTV